MKTPEITLEVTELTKDVKEPELYYLLTFRGEDGEVKHYSGVAKEGDDIPVTGILRYLLS